jgi:hypothetical protein
MRNEQPGLPIFFGWKVATRGYRWIDNNGSRWLCPVDALDQPDWHGILGQYQTQQPLLERSGLFRELAALQPTEPQILGFTNKFGLLTEGQSLPVDSKFGPSLVPGETLQLWQDEIRTLRLAVMVWDAASTGGNQLATQLKAALAKRDLPLMVRRALHVTDDDPMMTALSFIQRQTDAHLRRYVDSRLVFRESQPRLHLRLEPTTLLGALWLQFALSVDSLKRFVKCTECGAPFEVSRGQRTGKRPDAKFCSPRCRVGHYRGRIEEARRLRSSLRPNEIARKLNTSRRVINRWLATGKTKKPSRRH